MHKCLISRKGCGGEVNAPYDWRDVIPSGSTLAPWNDGNDQVAFDEEASEIAISLVTLCGEDPNTMTTEQMDNIEARVEYIRGAHNSRGRLVMTWRLAVSLPNVIVFFCILILTSFRASPRVKEIFSRESHQQPMAKNY